MTSKKLLSVLFLLGLLALLAKFVYDAQVEQIPAQARAEAPRYVRPSDAEVSRLYYERCVNDSEQIADLAMMGATCELLATPSTKILSLHHQQHEAAFYEREILPHELRLVNNMDWYVQASYTLLGLAALVAVCMWFRSTVVPFATGTLFPFAARGLSKIQPSFLSRQWNAAAANRKVRRAQSDFAALKNLHDNGLINEAMFAKRKKELQDDLSGNALFK